MSTTINVTYNKNSYLLEYSRQSVKQMEQQGFILDKIGDMPATMVPLLVYGAFLKHNKGIKRSLVDEIYAHIVDKTGDDGDNGFLQVLLEMYADTVNTLTGINADVEEGNAATWTVTKG